MNKIVVYRDDDSGKYIFDRVRENDTYYVDPKRKEFETVEWKKIFEMV